VETVRRLLARGVDDERGTWRCDDDDSGGGRSDNSTDRSESPNCLLTPSLLATTLAARRSVYSRTGLDCLAMFRGHSNQLEAAVKLQVIS